MYTYIPIYAKLYNAESWKQGVEEFTHYLEKHLQKPRNATRTRELHKSHSIDGECGVYYVSVRLHDSKDRMSPREPRNDQRI